MPERIRVAVGNEHTSAVVYPAAGQKSGATLILGHGAGPPPQVWHESQAHFYWSRIEAIDAVLVVLAVGFVGREYFRKIPHGPDRDHDDAGL